MEKNEHSEIHPDLVAWLSSAEFRAKKALLDSKMKEALGDDYCFDKHGRIVKVNK